MKKYYSLILFAVFVLLAGAILLAKSGKNDFVENNQIPSFVNDASNSGTSNNNPIDIQDDMNSTDASIESVDLENIEVDFEQDANETEDLLDDYSDFDQDIDADSIDEGLL